MPPGPYCTGKPRNTSEDIMVEGPSGALAQILQTAREEPISGPHDFQERPVKYPLRHTASQVSPGNVMQDIARSVLRSFGLRPFHVFDGEKYHVCFAVADEPRHELNFEPGLLDEFFSNCCRSRTSSKNHEDASPVFELPAIGHNEMPVPRVKESDTCTPPGSPKEVHYIMEEFYPSTNENGDCLGDCHNGENGQVPTTDIPARKEIVFIMEDNYRSPEEVRLSTCFPSLLRPSPKTAMDDCPLQGQAIPVDVEGSGIEFVETSTRTNAGKVGDGKSPKLKKKVRPVEECDPSQSVRLDKAYATTATQRKRRILTKKGSNGTPEEEPSWNGRDVGDLEEQTGDSWMAEERLRNPPQGNLGEMIRFGQAKKSLWPTPLYCSPEARLKPPASRETTTTCSPVCGVFDDENSDADDLQESSEQSKKREEVALAKYALLFKADRSWRKKFLDGFKLTCDICLSKRKIEKFSNVMALLAHAKSVKRVKRPEHRGYAQAVMNLLHLDEPGSTPACHSCAGPHAYPSDAVWPPVVVVENAVVAIGLNGCFVGLSASDLDHMLKALGDRGKRKLHQVLGENGLTGQVLVEFPMSHRGWIDAKFLHRQFELQARSYEDWLRLKPKFRNLLADTLETQESNGLLTILKDNKSLKRLLYGYMVTPRLIKHIDPDKRYVNWTVCTLKDVFDISDSDCSQTVQARTGAPT